MVEEKVNRRASGETGEEPDETLQGLGVGVGPADQGNPDSQRDPAPDQGAQVGQDPPVGAAGEAAVEPLVQGLEVEEEEVCPGENTLEGLPGHLSAGVNRRGDPLLAALLQ